MKVLTIGDLHFGKRKNDLGFLHKQLEYLEEILFKTEYDYIVQVGDIFDNRSSVNLYVLDKVVSLFKRIEKPMYVTLGNHDQWKKESGEVNILKLLNLVNPNIEIFQDTTDRMIGNDRVLFVPFIYNASKMTEMKQVMKKNKYKYIAGHFDFNEYGGKSSPITVSSENFKANTKMVISGHFHIQKDENVNGVRVKHIGTPYHLDRGDRYTNSGAWIYDTEQNTWDLIKNETSVKFIDIDLKDLLKGKSFDICGNVINIFVKTSIFNKLGSNSNERNNVLNGIVDSLKKHEPFELNVKPYNDNIEGIDGNEYDVEKGTFNFKELTDFKKMVDKYYEIRFKKTDYDDKLLFETQEIIKGLLS